MNGNLRRNSNGDCLLGRCDGYIFIVNGQLIYVSIIYGGFIAGSNIIDVNIVMEHAG